MKCDERGGGGYCLVDSVSRERSSTESDAARSSLRFGASSVVRAQEKKVWKMRALAST